MDVSGHVGAGWVPIVQKAVDELEAMGVGVLQIKEKFGGLRIYTDRNNEEINAIIDAAEQLCDETCEDCGKPGELRHDRSWLRTLCDEHAVLA